MRAAALLIAVLVLGGCAASSSGSVAGGSGSVAATPVELTVFGAASLSDVLQRAAAGYEAANPGTTVTLSTDSSAAMRTQIEQGAPADVFLSADTASPERLADAGLADGDPVPFATNHLTVIVPTANQAGIRSPADLAADGVRIIAAGDSVPITTYALEAVARLARLDGYPVGFAEAYAANVVSREDNVGALVAKVGLGEGDAAIVYATDAKRAESVTTVAIPAEANVSATYAGVVVRASRQRAAARGFLEWLVGAEGQAILADAGFLPPS